MPDTSLGFDRGNGDVLHNRTGGIRYDTLDIPGCAHALSMQPF